MKTTTYCNTDPKCPAGIRLLLNKIEEAFGKCVATSDNPCGGAAYYEVGERHPWRVHFADGGSDEQFATAEEAIQAAGDYASDEQFATVSTAIEAAGDYADEMDAE